MAASTPLITTEVSESPPPNKKRWGLMIAGIALLLCASAGAWLFMHPTKSDDKPAVVVVAPPVFIELEPFTVNLDAEHILQASLSLQLSSEADADQLKRYLPQVRDRLLMLMSSHSAESLRTPEGKEALARDIARRLQQAYANGLKPPKVDGVYFTAFVIQ